MLQDFSEPLTGCVQHESSRALPRSFDHGIPFYPEHHLGLNLVNAGLFLRPLPPSQMSALSHVLPPRPGPPQARASPSEVPALPDRCQPILVEGMHGPGGLAPPPGRALGVLWGMEGSAASGWASRRRSASDLVGLLPPQSYCLKVKEMDDEEYSCIVSSRGRLGVAPGLGSLGVYTPSPACHTEARECPGAAGAPGGSGQPGRGPRAWLGSRVWG